MIPLVDFEAAFGDLALPLPDGQVLGSRPSDWPQVLKAITRRGWSAEWNQAGSPVLSSDLHDPDRRGASFAVCLTPAVRVNFFLGDEALFDLDLDLDLREVENQDALDAICELVSMLGKSLATPVAISHEGNFNDVVVRYEPSTDKFTLSPAATN